jgi:uncharacterized protein (TIGR04141 family)
MSGGLKKINVFLIKEEVRQLDDVIKKNNKKPKKVELVELAGISEGVFYLARSNQKLPDWLDFVNLLAREKQKLKKNTSNSAVLVVRTENRLFAFSFGFGRFLVDMNRIERGFGLKVTLNIIDPYLLRTLDYKKYTDVVISTRQQVSRGSNLRTFDIDVDTELLKHIGGQVKAESESINFVNGADSVNINLKTAIEKANLANICSELLQLYKKEDYKVNFPWVDRHTPINNDADIKKMDQILLDTIKKPRSDDFYMAPPDIFDFVENDGFGFSTEKDETEPRFELEASDYLATLTDKSKLSIEDLKNDQVRVKSSSTGEWNYMWPIYNCIVFETTIENIHFVFHEGSWFKVEKEFVEILDSEIKSIPKTNIDLPTMPLTEEDAVIDRLGRPNKLELHHEKYFNEYVGWMYADKVTLDRRDIFPGGANTPIEFCDIITTRGQFVHVKPGTRSATLSHLFKQGSVSAELFLEDPEVRNKVREVIDDDPKFRNLAYWSEDEKQEERNKRKRRRLLELIPSGDKTVESRYFEVVFCIISKIPDNRWPEKLPFFSKLSLRSEKRKIRRMGFNVSLVKV